MSINKSCIQIEQDEIKIIVTTLTAEELINNTIVDVFDSIKNTEGYQRPIMEKHVDSICQYLITKDFSILPTSIILAGDKKDIIIENDKIIKFNSKLRIIDGQHRVEALKQYLFENNEDTEKTIDEEEQFQQFIKWNYPVNILCLDKRNARDRNVEVRAFVDINKRGKKVSTDLADSVISRINKKAEGLNIKESVQQICAETIKELNSDINSLWYQSIREGDQYVQNKLIGIASFGNSIKSIVRFMLIKNHGKKNIYSIDERKETKEILYNKLTEFWCGIADKWESAFNWDEENNAYRVDTDFNIQKTVGVFALNKVFMHWIKEEDDVEKGLKKAMECIQTSIVKDEDWEVGNRLSVYTSGAGHGKVKQIILKNSYNV